MNDWIVDDLRELVDSLAARGVAFASLREGDERLEITMRASGAASQAGPSALTPLQVVKAMGPGIFHHGHPHSEAAFPCVAAGDFLFPAAVSVKPHDSFLVPEGSLVEYGTPLLQRMSSNAEDIR